MRDIDLADEDGRCRVAALIRRHDGDSVVPSGGIDALALSADARASQGRPECGIAARPCALRDGLGPSVREGVSRSRLRRGLFRPIRRETGYDRPGRGGRLNGLSETGGQGDLHMKFGHYDPVPAQFQDEVIAAAKHAQEKDEA